MSEHKDARDREAEMRSEDAIRMKFADMGKDDVVCHRAFQMMMYGNYPLSAGLFLALEQIKAERDRFRELHLDYAKCHPAPVFIERPNTER